MTGFTRTQEQAIEAARRAPARLPVPALADMAHRRICPLTAFELDVLRLSADGFTSLRIARELGRTHDAVRSAGKRMLTKTATASRPQLVAVALRNGWIK